MILINFVNQVLKGLTYSQIKNSDQLKDASIMISNSFLAFILYRSTVYKPNLTRCDLLLGGKLNSRIKFQGGLLIDSDGSRYANGRRHFLCDTGARVGTRPIGTFFLAAWVGTGGTWLVHCVAKTVVLNNRLCDNKKT